MHLSSRKYFNESYYYLDESPATPAPSVIPDWDSADSESNESNGNNGNNGGSVVKSTSIPAHLYIQRVAALRAENGFASEFEALKALTAGDDFSANASQKADNQKKNRYPNVVACKLL